MARVAKKHKKRRSLLGRVLLIYELNRLIMKARLLIFDLRSWLSDIWILHKAGDFSKTKRREDTGLLQIPLQDRIAIVAIYPNAYSVFTIKNLCTALMENNFAIVLVAGAPLAQDVADELYPYCNVLIDRLHMGRDFGSYKMGIQWLHDNDHYETCKLLVLANDSMYWPADYGSSLNLILAGEPDWFGLFEHMPCGSSPHHVQSFFVGFGNVVFKNPKFLNFWQDYTPYSARKHAIRHGEAGLTKCLTSMGFKPSILYTSDRILNQLVENPFYFRPTQEIIHFISSDALKPNLYFTALQSTFAKYEASCSETEKSLLHWSLFQIFQETLFARLTTGNPTHTVGLFLNETLGAPVKRDLVYRDAQTLDEVRDRIRHFSQAEIELIVQDLRLKPPISTRVGFEYMLAVRDRL